MSNNFEAIHHISLIISDLKRSECFYCTILGLSIDSNRPKMSSDGLWLTINESQQIHLLLTDNPYKSVQRPKHAGLDRHVALKTNNFFKIKEHLDQYEIPYTMSKSGRKALFCHDPDNNILEILG